jgi:hypothetical protein
MSFAHYEVIAELPLEVLAISEAHQQDLDPQFAWKRDTSRSGTYRSRSDYTSFGLRVAPLEYRSPGG